MKKLICMILALTFCVCLACPVFASEADGGFVSSPGTEPDCTHDGDPILVGQKDATCTEEGYTGDYVCSACHEVIEPGKVIPKTEHKYVDGVCEVCGADENNPQTGDNGHIYLWLIVMVVAVASLVVVGVTYRKKFVNQ